MTYRIDGTRTALLIGDPEGRTLRSAEAFLRAAGGDTERVDATGETDSDERPGPRAIGDANPLQYDGLVIVTDGREADRMAKDPHVQTLVRTVHERGRPVAAVGDSVTVLVAAGVLEEEQDPGDPFTSGHILAATDSERLGDLLERFAALLAGERTRRQPTGPDW